MRKGKLVVFFGLIVVVITVLNITLVGSLVVSGVKALSDDCGKKYPVEIAIIYENLFCSK